MRAQFLFAVSIGCDVLPGGIVNFGTKGAKTLRQKFDSNSDPVAAEEDLINYLVIASAESKPTKYAHVAAGLSSDDFICLKNSLFYEPTCSGYLSGEPIALEKYNIQFSNGNQAVTELSDNVAKTVSCRGCLSSWSHQVLEAEGLYLCLECSLTTCRSCLWDPTLVLNDESCQPVCLSCKVDSLHVVDEMTEADMCHFLVQQKVTWCPTTASYEVVLELLTRYKTDGEGVLFLHDIKTVKYPLLPASSLHHSQLFHADSKIRPRFVNEGKQCLADCY
jgi:hypothetical protein